MTYVTESMCNTMKKCHLEQVSASPVETYRLRKPDSGIFRTLITFTEEGIVLSGNIIFNENCSSGGVVSDGRYDASWFSGTLSEDYLCSKFLRRQWVSEDARDYLEDLLKTEQDSLTDDQVRDIEDALSYETYQSCDFFHKWWQETFECPVEDIGLGYGRMPAGWVCAVQQRFSELYYRFKAGSFGPSIFDPEAFKDESMFEAFKHCKFQVTRKPGHESPFETEHLFFLEDALSMVEGNLPIPSVLCLKRSFDS